VVWESYPPACASKRRKKKGKKKGKERGEETMVEKAEIISASTNTLPIHKKKGKKGKKKGKGKGKKVKAYIRSVGDEVCVNRALPHNCLMSNEKKGERKKRREKKEMEKRANI